MLLISDIIKNMRTKRLFTNLDLCWRYNNIQIKKDNELKTAFTTSEGFFEPMVIFFGLTNSLVTFKIMINEIL